MADFLLKGMPYPIFKSPHGYLFSQQGIKQIKSDLLTLLLTNPKERVMEPSFGTPLRSLFFEQADKKLSTTARNIIIAALAKWEPRIAVKSVTVSIDPENNLVLITISFVDPQNIADTEVLTLELPIGAS